MIKGDFFVTRGEAAIHFQMEDSGVILLSGTNGAGKTTSLLCLAGILVPDSGTVFIGKDDITNDPPEKRRVVYINQNSYFTGMSVRDHLSIVTRDENMIRKTAEDFSLDFDSKVQNLSQGNKMRLAVATAALGNPRAILLDEVLSNISDPEEFLRLLNRISEENSTDIVFVSQNQAFSEYSSHHYRIESGNTVRIF